MGDFDHFRRSRALTSANIKHEIPETVLGIPGIWLEDRWYAATIIERAYLILFTPQATSAAEVVTSLPRRPRKKVEPAKS